MDLNGDFNQEVPQEYQPFEDTETMKGLDSGD